MSALPINPLIKTMRIRLGVNVDHVATIRQQRDTRFPDPVAAAFAAELAGADQITVHLREDRRHIQDRDLDILKETVQTKLNLEMAVTDEMKDIALRLVPHIVTLVPERPEERTTEGGLDLRPHAERNVAYIQKLKDAGILVSIFVDPVREQIQAAKDQGATMIELHTGDFAAANDDAQRDAEFEKIKSAAQFASSIGLAVAAGHGLDYRNVYQIKEIEEIEELNIGHSIVSHSIMVGFERAVREMIDAMKRD